MPLKNELRDKGKSGFKLLQYMGLGVVGVASAVTVNKEIIDDEKNGFLVADGEWEQVLSKVISLRKKFPSIGFEAYTKVAENYSFDANIEKLSSFVNQNDKKE